MLGDRIDETCLGYAAVDARFAFGAVFFLLADGRRTSSGLVYTLIGNTRSCDISRDGNGHNFVGMVLKENYLLTDYVMCRKWLVV